MVLRKHVLSCGFNFMSCLSVECLRDILRLQLWTRLLRLPRGEVMFRYWTPCVELAFSHGFSAFKAPSILVTLGTFVV